MVSLLNGLSALGQGVATFAGSAALEQQKSALQAQAMTLAQQFQAGENTLNRAAEMARTQATINAPPEAIRTLRELGIIPKAGAATAPSVSGADSSPPAPATSGSATPDTSAATTPMPSITTPSDASSVMSNPLVMKLLNQPMPGSEDAVRRAIAQDVVNDPNFKGASPGKIGTEIENRLAIAKGTLGSPEDRDAIAEGIASYQLSPIDQRARQMAGGPATMAAVMGKNPAYLEAKYPEVNKTMIAFGPGKQGDQIRFINNSVQHIGLLNAVGQALENHDMQAVNAVKNQFQAWFGVAVPNSFDGIKQIVGTEIEKAIAGGIGAIPDRERLMKALSRANSPQQLQDVTKDFQILMAGQVNGLKQQYDDGTDFPKGSAIAQKFAFEKKLLPETIKALGLRLSGSADTQQPKTDAQSTTPKVPDVGAVMDGYKFKGGDPSNQSSWEKVP